MISWVRRRRDLPDELKAEFGRAGDVVALEAEIIVDARMPGFDRPAPY